MKVKELKKYLETVDDNLDVMVGSHQHGWMELEPDNLKIDNWTDSEDPILWIG